MHDEEHAVGRKRSFEPVPARDFLSGLPALWILLYPLAQPLASALSDCARVPQAWLCVDRPRVAMTSLLWTNVRCQRRTP